MITEYLGPFFYAQPFEPFAMFIADGRRIDVPHPEFALLGRSGLVVWLMLAGGEIELLDSSLITSLQTLGPAEIEQFMTR